MITENIYRLIKIDEQSVTPKYQQLTNSILNAIERGRIGKDYPLPSINDLSYELEISRDTAEKAYRHLKKLGVIGSVPGKGYFIAKTDFRQSIKIFLLFNKLSAHKKIIYDSFVGVLGQQAAIDFYIYNNDFNLFKKLLQSRKNDYTHHVIIPHFIEGGENAAAVINEISDGNLILLDKLIPGIKNEYGAVFENFETDIYNALKEALPHLQKYQTLKITFPSYTYFPEEIVKGFQSFCIEYAFNHKVVHNISAEEIKEGEVYINLMEDDLVVLLEKIEATHLAVGKNIGIISYNETPWKRFILDGITTISTDFKKMGEMAAQMVLNNEKNKLEVPFTLKLRNSV
ncbi:MAG: GntR family transcriptional regulator [Bacteroidetes bacterium]|nr:MAG: GntR family transcriptional regulator [Bacteroidota bacterium]